LHGRSSVQVFASLLTASRIPGVQGPHSASSRPYRSEPVFPQEGRESSSWSRQDSRRDRCLDTPPLWVSLHQENHLTRQLFWIGFDKRRASSYIAGSTSRRRQLG